MSKKSTFGAEPERLKRLLTAIGLEKPSAGEQSNRTVTSSQSTRKLGGHIGRYKLLSVLGEGGMGVVYLAEQERPIRRQVALKVIKPGMDSARVIARFEAERQALALLDHPNIAHVHDAGTTENGRPYFVMEYDKGLPITEHCDKNKLTIADRLGLFRQVCLAVHHAHQKGIIHRDIKPSNILISTQDNQAVPKIIDFGVAKALSMPLTERTLTTEVSQLLGTPEYMSPEQADMINEDIDIRSDIYSLGVLLYVLLTGVLPFDSTTLREGGIERIRQVIREVDPKTPSTRLTRLGDGAKKVAESRSTQVATLAKRLHKELEWIPLKAMYKERSERYRSASELADDIENYLNGDPLLAGPLSAAYRLEKLVRRNRVLVSGAATVLFVLVAGIIVSTVLAIGQARARAEAQAVADFLKDDVLASVDPAEVMGREVTVRYLLDAASENLEGKFEDELLVEASIRQILGVTYMNLGEFKAAEPHLERALEIRQEQLGAEDSHTLDSMDNLARLYRRQSRYNEAEVLLVKALKIGRQVLGEEDLKNSDFMVNLGDVYLVQGRYDKAEVLFVKALKITRRVLGEEHPKTLRSMGDLASLYMHQGRYDEAEPLQLRTLEIRKRVLSEKHPDITLSMRSLVTQYRYEERYDEAEALCIKVLKIRRRLWGEKHPNTLRSMNDLAQVYMAQDQYDEAEPLLAKALEGRRRELGEEHLDALVSMNCLATLYTGQGRYDEAKPLFKRTLETMQRVLGEKNPYTLTSMHNFAMLYIKQKRYDEAEPLLIEALEGRRLKLGDTHQHTKESLNNLIKLYEAWNKSEKAEKWRSKLVQTEAKIE